MLLGVLLILAQLGDFDAECQRGRCRIGGRVTLSRPYAFFEFALDGRETPLALQCTGDTLYTEAPRQSIAMSRASSAYCEKSDGTLVLLGNDVPRRERMGLRIEPSAVNLIGASGAAARDLTASGWTASNMTCAKTATGADGAANSASRCTATSTNATITYAVTVASAKRSSSMYLRRVTGSGAVTVTRSNFSAGTDVSASLSTTTWKRVLADCGGRGSDLAFSRLDNCIAVSAMTATAANPTVGVKLATSGDVVEIDFVQDEATDYPTSPMAGFDRALDQPTVALDGGLPATEGEISVDWVAMRSAGADPGDFPVPIATTAIGSGDGIIMWHNTDNANTGAYVRNGSGLTSLANDFSFGLKAGRGRNHRVSWGDGNAYFWVDGLPSNKVSDGSANMPATHSGPYRIGNYANDETSQLGGWVSRVRWTAGDVTSFHGSSLAVVLIGDSIVEAENPLVTEGYYPEQVMQSGIGGRRYDKYVTSGGSSGNTIDQCDANARAYIDEAVLYGAQSQLAIVFQCGTNSSGDGADSVWGKILTLRNDSVDAGVRFLPATITPYSTNDSFIDGVNQRMRNVFSDAGVAWAETYRAMEYPADSGILNPAYDFGDGLHVKAAGAAAEATVWLNAGRAAGYW